MVDLRDEGTSLEGRSEDGRLLEVEVGRESSLGRKKVIRVPSCSWHNKWLIISESSHLVPVSGERDIRWSYSGT